MRTHIKTIREILKERPYGSIAFMAIALFAILNLWLLTRTTTLPSFLSMAWNGSYFGDWNLGDTAARTVGLTYAVLFWLMTLFTVLLFGPAVALLYWLFKRSRGGKAREMKMGVGATVASMFASGCPVCGTFLFSLIGVAGGIGIFPLEGLELKALSLGLMAGSVAFASKRVAAFKVKGCESGVCEVIVPHSSHVAQGFSPDVRPEGLSYSPSAALRGDRMKRGLVWAITILLAVNQFMIGSMVPKASGAKRASGLRALFGAQGAQAREIIAPQLNPDGRTTSLVKQPTISEIPAEPKGLDPVEAAKAVMIPTGVPAYAPPGVSFDDPISAQQIWGSFENSIQLPSDLEQRYQTIISTFSCNYCCGGPNRVTTINRCGCRHAKAWRGMAKYLLQNYGVQYSDEAIKGEMYRWTGIWYPKGVVEDYLLATGRGEVLGHEPHGGAGSDGMHGLAGN